MQVNHIPSVDSRLPVYGPVNHPAYQRIQQAANEPLGSLAHQEAINRRAERNEGYNEHYWDYRERFPNGCPMCQRHWHDGYDRETLWFAQAGFWDNTPPRELSAEPCGTTGHTLQVMNPEHADQLGAPAFNPVAPPRSPSIVPGTPSLRPVASSPAAASSTPRQMARTPTPLITPSRDLTLS
ncbi:hypothetical protein QFC21_000705 [Naganishia friedmannii]|uniref:Uncharacterized protein n=1 Tax=Naganishia friedmannii TaxID=89922 RepID=A0ACC2W690_9TREE|nr:hypothetical protein QFC21_000705 [Naganishia friedmannii]